MLVISYLVRFVINNLNFERGNWHVRVVLTYKDWVVFRRLFNLGWVNLKNKGAGMLHINEIENLIYFYTKETKFWKGKCHGVG